MNSTNFADEHGKLMAVTETGLACSSADPGHNQTVLHETGNKNLNWYNMVLDVVSEVMHLIFLLRANFGKKGRVLYTICRFREQ